MMRWGSQRRALVCLTALLCLCLLASVDGALKKGAKTKNGAAKPAKVTKKADPPKPPKGAKTTDPKQAKAQPKGGPYPPDAEFVKIAVRTDGIVQGAPAVAKKFKDEAPAKASARPAVSIPTKISPPEKEINQFFSLSKLSDEQATKVVTETMELNLKVNIDQTDDPKRNAPVLIAALNTPYSNLGDGPLPHHGGSVVVLEQEARVSRSRRQGDAMQRLRQRALRGTDKGAKKCPNPLPIPNIRTDKDAWRLAKDMMELASAAYKTPAKGTTYLSGRVTVRETFTGPKLLELTNVLGGKYNGPGFIATDDTNVYVCTRGSASAADWLVNAHASMVPFKIGRDTHGYVHEGFNYLWAGTRVIDKYSKYVLEGGKRRKLVFVGHSLGGAIAQLNALEAAIAYQVMPRVYTFGSPRVGDSDFGKSFREHAFHLRVTNKADVVPKVPVTAVRAAPMTLGLIKVIYFYQHACDVNMRILAGADGDWECRDHEDRVHVSSVKDSFADHTDYPNSLALVVSKLP